MTLALALLLAAPVAAMPSPAATLAAPATDADRLVRLLASDETVTGLATRLFDVNIQKDANLPADKRALFAANPGLKAYVADKTRGEMATILKRELPTLRGQLSGLFTREMSGEEIAATLTFFSTTTGQKMLAQIYRGVGDSGATTEAEAQQAAMSSLMASLTPEDYPALAAFGSSSAAQKLQALNPRISAASRNWAQDVVTRNQPRLLAVADKATADYLASHK